MMDFKMDFEIVAVLTTLNFWIISLAGSILLTLARRLITMFRPAIEDHKVYKILLPLAPYIICPLLALIPGLRITEVVSQSLVLGLIAGAFSGATYPVVARIFKLLAKEKAE